MGAQSRKEKAMADVTITLRTGNGDFSVDLERPEIMREAFGADKTHLDRLVDEAVIRIKRAYTPPAEPQGENA